ncbi:MAG: hypothetical protein ACTS5I_18135 [Rhodanobacter sp.]
MRTSGTLVEIRPQLLYGSASGQPGGLIEFASLTQLAIHHAGAAPLRLEVKERSTTVSGRSRRRDSAFEFKHALPKEH